MQLHAIHSASKIFSFWTRGASARPHFCYIRNCTTLCYV